MIYNLEQVLPLEVIKNGVYESLTPPKFEKRSVDDYIKLIEKEINDCPYIHCPDYDLLVPISLETRVKDADYEISIHQAIIITCFFWWKDEFREKI